MLSNRDNICFLVQVLFNYLSFLFCLGKILFTILSFVNRHIVYLGAYVLALDSNIKNSVPSCSYVF